MQKSKSSLLHTVIMANALFLVLGTVMQANDNAALRTMVLSLLFLGWLGVFVWYIASARAAE